LSLFTRLPLARLSFRWQIILLGTLVFILSLAVLFAITATLRYTKSAILSEEKDRLIQIARNLSQEYEDKADLARRNHQPPPLRYAESTASQDVLALLSRIVLQNAEGTAGGFYTVAEDALIGSYFPIGERASADAATLPGTPDTSETVRGVARTAAATHEPAEKVLLNAPGILLIVAVPLRDESSVVGSTWSFKRFPDLPGANRFRAYLVTSALGATALASVLLTLFVIRSLQGGVHKIEGSLKTLEGSLTSGIRTEDEPEEIQDIVHAINRLGAALREKMEHEKEIENQLRHAERLAGLGRLVAGVAHEVRNPLATIRLRTQMCARDTDNPRVKESCSIALLEIERLNGMVNRLLSFARPVQLRFETVDVRKLVEERIESFRDLALRCRVGIDTDFAEASAPLTVDRSRMVQVFDNILQNAIEAMSDGGGTLAVSLASSQKPADNSGSLVVAFRDTGKGMNDETLSHVFDPFFTTKTSGTGLGLSICRELVSAHGGKIEIESEEGCGTTVRITIPPARTTAPHGSVTRSIP